MKSRIEDGDLRNRSESRFHEIHRLDRGRVVKRRKLRQSGNALFDFWRDHNRLNELLATVDDAVPHDFNFRRLANHARGAHPEEVKKMFRSLAMRFGRRRTSRDITSGVPRVKCRNAAPFDLSLPERPSRTLWNRLGKIV